MIMLLLDQSAEKIVDTAKKTGAKVSGPIPLTNTKRSCNNTYVLHTNIKIQENNSK